ncbi:MAG: ATP synthase F0 subunit C [Lachnospiraceae bacterium]|nr:ATP synthase F0 subunit C [Lachnospiraceae bacterium]
MKKKVLIFAAVLTAALVLVTCIPAARALAAGAQPEAQALTAAGDVQEEGTVSAASETSSKAWAAGVAIAVTAGLGALSMGLAIARSVDGIARQPEASGSIRTALMLGLVFIETAIIYALIVAILVIFVL